MKPNGEHAPTDFFKVLLVDLGLLVTGVYCAGRWYKEAYLWEFGIPWDLQDYSHTHYLFTGWFSLLWVGALVFLAYNLWLNGWPREGDSDRVRVWFERAWILLGHALVLSITGWCLLWFEAPEWWSARVFHWKGMGGYLGWVDWDMLLASMIFGGGLACFRLHVFRSTLGARNALPRILRELFFLKKLEAGLSLPTTLSVALVVLLGAFVASSAMARYHVSRALKYGFGHPVVTLKDSPTARPELITRMGTDRNFLRTGPGRFTVVKDAAITHYGAP